TTSPNSSLTIAGTSNAGQSSAAVELSNTTAVTGRRYLLGSTTGGLFQIADVSAGGLTRMVVDSNGNVGIGTIAPAQKLVVNGTARVTVLEITGADVAEKFPSTDAAARPGTVMEIDPDHPGKLRIARAAYSSRVAGVISGAGDLPAGAVLGH